jgi:hypothetical protein
LPPASVIAATGVVAGSFAAAWQASLGGTIAAGSAFATLQSIAMAGAGAGTGAAGAGAGTGAAGAALGGVAVAPALSAVCTAVDTAAADPEGAGAAVVRDIERLRWTTRRGRAPAAGPAGPPHPQAAAGRGLLGDFPASIRRRLQELRRQLNLG